MSDRQQRRADRLARASNDVEAAARALALRMRIFAPGDRESRLRLAAYCGHLPARELLGQGRQRWLVMVFRLAGGNVPGYWKNVEAINFPNWVNGLVYWPSAPLRAALASSETMLRIHLGPDNVIAYSGCSDALLKARAFVENPSDARLEAWRLANIRAGYPVHIQWIPPAVNWGVMPRAETVRRCVAKTSEDEIRAAVRAELIDWALSF